MPQQPTAPLAERALDHVGNAAVGIVGHTARSGMCSASRRASQRIFFVAMELP